MSGTALRHAIVAGALFAGSGCWLLFDLREGEPCPEEPCRLLSPQCGCREGKMCALRDAERVCVTPDGAARPGEACTGPFDCLPGAMCAVHGGAPPTCLAFCEVDADCGPPASLCALPLLAGGVTLCSTACDPVTSGGCGVPGAKCELERLPDPSPSYYTACIASGPGTRGQLCAASSDCGFGLGCIRFTGSPECAPYCVLGDATCPGGTSCRPLVPPARVGALQYGACH